MEGEADGTIQLPLRLRHDLQASFSPWDIIAWCMPLAESRAPSDKDWCLLRLDPDGWQAVQYFWYESQEQARTHASRFPPDDADCPLPYVFHVSVEARVAALAVRVKSRVGSDCGRVPNDAEVLQRKIMERIANASEQHKTHIYVEADHVPPNFVPVLKKHFHVQPVNTKIGTEILGRRKLEFNLEEEYLRICWSSWGMASMKKEEEKKE